MRKTVTVLLAAALGASSAFLVACGDRNSLIPRSDASALQSSLDRASELYDQEECRAAQAAVLGAEQRAADLPDDVDPELRRQVDENLAAVLSRIQEQCGKRETTQTTQTETTPTETTQTTQTTTTTPPPTTTTTEPTPPPTTTKPALPVDPSGSGGTPPGVNSG